MGNPDTELDRFMLGLHAQQPDWWIKFMPEQGWRDIGYAAKQKDYGNVEIRIGSWKRSIAQDLFMAVRAAIEAGLVKPI